MAMNIVTSEFIDSYGKFAVWGASKQGKTYWALQCASILANGGKVGVISTERGNDMFLAKRFPHDTIILNFDEDGDPIPQAFSRQRVIEALDTFIKAGYKAVVLDSASAVWEGEGGFLEEAKNTNKEKGKQEKDFQVWDTITPIFRDFMNKLLDAPIHLVCTVRGKDKYTYEAGKNGRMEPHNKGESPIQRSAFFFDLYGHFHIHEFTARIEGTYCDPLLEAFPGREIGPDEQEKAFSIMRDWLKGKEKEPKSPMELEMLRYKAHNLEWAQKTNQWKQRLIYTILPHYKGQAFPAWKGFTDEDVQKVRSWVDEKLQPKQQTAPQPVTPVQPQVNQPVSRDTGNNNRPAETNEVPGVTDQQLASIRKLCQFLRKTAPEGIVDLSFESAKNLIQQLTAEYKELKQQQQNKAS